MGNEAAAAGLHRKQLDAPEQELELPVAQGRVAHGKPGVPFHAGEKDRLGDIQNLSLLPAPQYRLQLRICQQITDAETLPRSQGIELHILAIQCHGIDLHPSGHDHPHG